ncbi:MAG: DUF1636 domain-containing protein [Leptolyngbyaceae cyanobacterium RM2_2_4]|nr:DUF1636 domain-containing protein [Leptolyngbyaceae cyanobacterium SM1_4_3]NJN91186.1 DUF1636 domain-containing protein [Leptolyngbyaceae cyanobacterium SL_5_14]NJO50245.1 DUF1636 domain-containing protein [Leptolyngbyaceae cyanobacterium RM2_2_4]
MTRHTLFVCKSCSATIAHKDVTDDTITEGVLLLKHLQKLQQNRSIESELNVEAVGCLWTCDRPCAVAFSAPDKATYLFTKVPANADEALLQFGELYLNSKAGDIPWKQFPEVLQSAEVAKIPSILEGKD